MKNKDYKIKVDTLELLDRILGVAVNMKKREDQLRRTIQELQSALQSTVGFSTIHCEL
jgi:hypothetical protein